MAQTNISTDGHGDSMTNSAQWGQVGENLRKKVNCILTTPTEEPKLNHWVNTTLNQLVIQFKPSNRCIKKNTFNFTFFLKISAV